MSRILYAKLDHQRHFLKNGSCYIMSIMSRRAKKSPRMGRPATGLHGEKVSDYPQVMIRLPQQTKAALDALSGATGTPIWRLIDAAVAQYIESLPDAQRRLIAGVRSLRAGRADS
jgi:hypothetical protein